MQLVNKKYVDDNYVEYSDIEEKQGEVSHEEIESLDSKEDVYNEQGSNSDASESPVPEEGGYEVKIKPINIIIE